jgi:hypothetical protein
LAASEAAKFSPRPFRVLALKSRNQAPTGPYPSLNRAGVKLLLGLGVGGAPQVGLAAGHVEEVFPRLGLEVLELLLVHGLAELGQRGHGVHHDRTAAFLHFEEHQVVAQAGRGDRSGAVRSVLLQLFLGGFAGCKVLAQAVEGLGLEEQEPGADRAVAVLEPGRGETVFHHGELGADLGPEIVGGAGVPHRVPGPALALADRPRLIDVDRAAAGDHAGFALEDVDLVLTHREAGAPAIWLGLFLSRNSSTMKTRSRMFVSPIAFFAASATIRL